MFNKNLCEVCGDDITDPVCTSCYVNQTRIILNDLKLSKKMSDFVLKKIAKTLPYKTLNDTECILCCKENVSICRYCFSVGLVIILRKLKFPEEIIENFGYNPLYEENSTDYEDIERIEFSVRTPYFV